MITVLVIFNTIFNVIFIGYLFDLHNKFSFGIEKNRHFNKITGIQFYFGTKYSKTGFLHIPIRNYKKLQTKEDIEVMMNPNNPNKIYTLHAKFSWLKTIEQVREFEKNYSVVDSDVVKELVDNFIHKNNGK